MPPTTATLTVDAANEWAYVSLDGNPRVVAVSDSEASTGWDIAFHATAVKLNGGDVGPADVAGYCVCANAAASPASIMAMTAESELAAFEATTRSALPSADGWITDTESAGGVFTRSPWYRYNLADQHQVWPTYDVYLIRRGTEVTKIQITGYYGPTGDPRQITLRSARIDD